MESLKQPLRVLHTESSINMGGQELRILRQMRWLLDHGHETWLLARRDSDIYEKAQQLGLPVHDCKLRGSINPGVTWEILQFCRRHRVDVIDCHSMRDASLVMPLRWLGYPVLHSQHICKDLKDNLAHRLVWKLGAQRLLATSQSIADRLVAQHLSSVRRIDIVGEAVDCSVYRPDLKGEGIREAWGIPAEAKLVTVIAMIRPDKAQHQLVRAAERICASIPEAWFMFVGSPTKTNYVERFNKQIRNSPCRDRMVLTGFQEHVENYMAASDLIVMTSRSEAQSMIIPQAFALRRVVVAPEIGGIPELIRHRETGYLYPTDVPELEDETVRILADTVVEALQSDNTAILDSTYEMACQKLCVDRQMERTLEVYHRTMGSK